MKRLMVVSVSLCVLLGVSGRARALSFPSFHDAVCTTLKASPYYWQVYAAAVALKDAGELNSQMDCLDVGDFLGDLGIPSGTFKDCVCEAIGWPPAQPPVCSDAHDACTAGGPLAASSAMMSCQASPSQDVAGKVCASDPFCCTSAWDSTCVAEAATEFWKAMEAEGSAIVSRGDLTCDQINQMGQQLQQEANADSAALPCLGYKSIAPACVARSGRNHF
jgi:hypothetical protein